MGQEASVPFPEGHDASGEPSHNGSRRSAKALGSIMRRDKEGLGEHIDKEMARAAAEGGHFGSQEEYHFAAMTPEQQEAFIMRQQYEQQVMRQQQQQQQEHQQAYMMQSPPQQQYVPNGIPPPPREESPRPDTAVTVMMTADAARGGKGGKLPGTRLINSMKNLAINAKGAAGAVIHAEQEELPGVKATGSVSDWQRQWEADDESDEEDEEDAKMPASPLRPAMDQGYSLAGFGVPNAEPRMIPAPQSPARGMESATMPVSAAKDGVIRDSPNRQPMNRQESDGVEWDTGAQVMPVKEKPSIEMFLPMLRVLGKGSFGKVRSFAFTVCVSCCCDDAVYRSYH